MTSDFYFTATFWFQGNVRVKPHSKHSWGWGRSGNPISTRGADYAHNTTNCPPSPPLRYFQTFLRPCMAWSRYVYEQCVPPCPVHTFTEWERELSPKKRRMNQLKDYRSKKIFRKIKVCQKICQKIFVQKIVVKTCVRQICRKIRHKDCQKKLSNNCQKFVKISSRNL